MVKEWPELTEAKWNEEHKSSHIKDVFTSRSSRRMRLNWLCQVLTCTHKHFCSENTTKYKRISIVMERVVTLKRALIVMCKRVVHYSVIWMTHYTLLNFFRESYLHTPYLPETNEQCLNSSFSLFSDALVTGAATPSPDFPQLHRRSLESNSWIYVW